MSFLLFGLGVALAVPLQAPIAPAPQFDWKLRLAKGQTWTQTIETRTTTSQDQFSVEKTQTVTLKNEVISAASTVFLIRSTFTRWDEETKPRDFDVRDEATKQLRPSLAGGSFTWRQAIDGRVFDVQGAVGLAARQKKAIRALAKTPVEAGALENQVFTDEELRVFVTEWQSLFLPRAPLRAGQFYVFPMVLSRTLYALPVEVKRTLRSFDGREATWNDSAKIGLAPTQLSGPTKTTVLLTRDAAQMYLYEKAKRHQRSKKGG